MDRRTFLTAAGVWFLAGCSADEQEDNPSSESVSTAQSTTDDPVAESPLRGVSLSPRSFSDEEFTEFFELVEQADLAVRWAGDWQDLSTDTGGPTVVCSLTEQYGYQPIIETGVFSVDEGELFHPLDDAGQAAFVEAVTDFVAEWEPPYFGVGVEVNLHAEERPDEFETFVSLYDETYDAIKEASPSTQVYTGFQLEWVRGLRGGIFGGENDPDQSQWDLIDRFPKRDLVAFTSYPDLVFERPADIPDDYYVEAANHAGETIAITETGWSPVPKGLDWERSEAQQVEFAERLFDLTGSIDIATLVWLWMYDQGGDNPAFEDMTLRRSDGSARPVWDVWAAGIT